MPSNMLGHTWSLEELSHASPSKPQKLPTLTYSIEMYGVSTNNVLSMAYAKKCKKGHFSRITFYAN